MEPRLVAPGIVSLGGAFYNLAGQRVCGAARERGGLCRRVIGRGGRCSSHGLRGAAGGGPGGESEASHAPGGVASSPRAPLPARGGSAEEGERRPRTPSGEETTVWSAHYRAEGPENAGGLPPSPLGGNLGDSAGISHAAAASRGETGWRVPLYLAPGWQCYPLTLPPLPGPPPHPYSSPGPRASLPPGPGGQAGWPAARMRQCLSPGRMPDSQDILADGERADSGPRRGRREVVLDSPERVRSILREHLLAPVARRAFWTEEETSQLARGIRELGFGRWKEIAARYLPNRTPAQLQSRARVCRRWVPAQAEFLGGAGAPAGGWKELGHWASESSRRATALPPPPFGPGEAAGAPGPAETGACREVGRVLGETGGGARPEACSARLDAGVAARAARALGRSAEPPPSDLTEYKRAMCRSAMQIELRSFKDAFP